MSKIKIAIVGIGNCACSLIQGIEYYKSKNQTMPHKIKNQLNFELLL